MLFPTVRVKRIVFVNPGVGVERYRLGLPCGDLKQNIGLVSGEKHIFSVGRLAHRKGFDMDICSLPELISQGVAVCYTLIGIGEDHDYLTNRPGRWV